MNIYLHKERERLASMRKLLKIDFNKDESIRQITGLASDLFETPVSMVTLLDKDVQFIISSHGLQLEQMPRATSFCTHAIQQDDVMMVNDTLEDKRFEKSPLVLNQPHVRFYAGIPLKFQGDNVGTLCVFNDKPMDTDLKKVKHLKILGEQVSNLMTLSSSLKVLKESHRQIRSQFKMLREIAFIQSHEIRAPLCNAMALSSILKSDKNYRDDFHLQMLENSLNDLDGKIHGIVKRTVLQ